jgi:hypothetical protein
VLEKYRAEQKIVPCSDPEAKFISEELMALVKGQLHPVAKLGGELHQAVASLFKDCGLGEQCPVISRRSSNGSRSCPTGSTSGRSLRPEPALRKLWSPCSRVTQVLAWTS